MSAGRGESGTAGLRLDQRVQVAPPRAIGRPRACATPAGLARALRRERRVRLEFPETALNRREESLGNKYSMSTRSSRVNRVIPVAVEAMPFEAHGGELRVGHGHTTRVASAIQL
jgi:hypothetical protein